MANTKEFNVKFNGIEQATDNVGKLSDEFDNLNDEVGKINANMANASNAMGKAATSASVLGSNLNTVSNTSSLGSAAVTKMGNALDKLAVKVSNVSRAIQRVGWLLIIQMVVQLIRNWEEWGKKLDETFPQLQKFGGVVNNVRAVLRTLTNTIKDLGIAIAKTFNELFSGNFKAAFDEMAQGIRNVQDEFRNYQQTLQQIANEQNTKQQIKELQWQRQLLEAKKGQAGRYSDEAVRMFDSEIKKRQSLYKKDSEEWRSAELEKLNFYRQMQDYRTQAAQAALKKRQQLEEEAKKRSEKLYQEVQGLSISVQSALANLANREIERMNKLLGETPKTFNEINKIVGQTTISINETFRSLEDINLEQIAKNIKHDVFDSIGVEVATLEKQLEEFRVQISDYVKSGIRVSPGSVRTLVSSMFGEYNLNEEQMHRLSSMMIQYWQDYEEKFLECVRADDAVMSSQLNSMKTNLDLSLTNWQNYFNDVNNSANDLLQGKTSVWYRLFNPKDFKEINITAKADWEALKGNMEFYLKGFIENWENYIDGVGNLYGIGSTEYVKAMKEYEDAYGKFMEMYTKATNLMNAKTPADTRKSKYKNTDETTDFDTIFAKFENFDEMYERLSDISQALFENVFDPIEEAFTAMLQFQLDEAQEALDKATEMHEAMLDKISESQSRIAELNAEMANSSGAQLEALKTQLADEMTLLAQREAEEKRLAAEKARREAEVEKKQKQMRKLELQGQLVEAIINTAVASTKAMSQWGWPLGAVFAAILSSMGAVQVATITKQMSKLADGGLISGPSHAQGGVPVGNTGIEVEGGEAVINKKSTEKYLPLLDAINADGNGGKHTLLKGKNVNTTVIKNNERLIEEYDNVINEKTINNVLKEYASSDKITTNTITSTSSDRIMLINVSPVLLQGNPITTYSNQMPSFNYQNVSNVLQSNNTGNMIKESIDNIELKPIVSVVDIARGVNNLTTVRQMAGSNKLLK